MSENKKIYRAVIYCRLSKEDSNKNESNSITNQKMFCEEYAKKQNDIKLVRDAIVDDGVSGLSFERVGFKELENEIKNGNIDCIICRDLSRFSRNYIESGRYLERIFPSLGIRFIAINDNYDSLNSDISTASYILPFKNLINDSYCKDISIKIRSSLEIKRKNGDFVGSFCPYGYKKCSYNKNKLLVDEKVSDNILFIFSSYKNGFTINNIACKLNELGILTPHDYKQSEGINYNTSFKISKNSKWEYNTVKRILTNEIYKGTLAQGKRGSINYKLKTMQTKHKNEWIISENTHSKLISPEDFDAIQRIMSRDMRSVSNANNGKNTLSGFIFCGDCNSTMIRKVAKSKNKQYTYYICKNHLKHKNCTSHSITANALENAIIDTFNSQLNLINSTYNFDTIMNKAKINNNSIYENQIIKLNKEIEKYNFFKTKLYEDYSENIINEYEYKTFKNSYNQFIDDKKSIINNLEIELNSIINDSENKDKDKNKIELNRRILISFIDKINVYENNKIEIIFLGGVNYGTQKQS